MPAAAAVELFVAALDVFDDIEDQDNERALSKRLGQAEALNAATALLMAAQSAMARLRLRQVDDRLVARSMGAIAEAGVMACSGQHHDIENESKPWVTEARYFNMVRMKSASLVACAARLGAILGGAGEPSVESLGRFGQYLGIAAQITNDVQSIGVQQSGTSDVIRKKKTLPVIFALGHADRPDRDSLAAFYRSDAPVDSQQERRVLEILRRSGAIQYSLVRSELYRRKATRLLEHAGIPHAAVRTITSTLGLLTQGSGY